MFSVCIMYSVLMIMCGKTEIVSLVWIFFNIVFVLGWKFWVGFTGFYVVQTLSKPSF